MSNTLDPTLPRLHEVESAKGAIAYIVAHIQWQLDHPLHSNPSGLPTPFSMLHRLLGFLARFVDLDRSKRGKTFDNAFIVSEDDLAAAVAVTTHYHDYYYHGRLAPLKDHFFTGMGWWVCCYQLLNRLNAEFLPLERKRKFNRDIEDNTEELSGVPDPPLRTDDRQEFIRLLEIALAIKFEKGPSRQLWLHADSPRFCTAELRLNIYDLNNQFYLHSIELDGQAHEAEEYRNCFRRILS